MVELRLVPPPDPENRPPDEPLLENYVACPDGALVSGHYIEWNGNFYEGYSIGSDLWIRHRVDGNLPAEWIPIPGSFNEASGRTTYRRSLPRHKVDRYVAIQLAGDWHGLRFGIEAYLEDGTVAVRGGYSPEMIRLLESGSAPHLEAVESGRAGVTGELPWAEMSNFSTEVRDLPLPDA